MDFPHLQNVTSFPINNNPPQVYTQYINRFDYTSWSNDTVVQLCSVPWDSVTNAVCFKSDEERSQYFANLPDSLTIKLDVFTRIIKGIVKVPIPYDVSNIYNYAHVTFPTMPIEGENSKGVKEWGFFIEDINYISPSTTQLTLSVDWFTWFINDVHIKNVQLQQGHWAVANSADVESFLKNPILNLENLTDSEGDTVNSYINTQYLNEFFNVNSNIVIFNLKSMNPQGDFTNTIPNIGRANTSAGAPMGVLLAVEADNFANFINSLNVGFYSNIKCIWIVPEMFFNLSSSFKINNIDCYYVLSPKSNTYSIRVYKADFNYPDSVKNFTKLYTSQYAHVTVQRSDGVTFQIPINDITDNSKTVSIPSYNDDSLQIITYIDGLASDYTGIANLRRLQSDEVYHYSGLLNSNYMTLDVPTYAVYIDNDSLQDYRKQFERTQARANASIAQTNSNASADTAKSNADASADTAKSNADASADTAKSNADASADTAKSNTTRSTNNSVANTKLSVDNSTTNQGLTNQLTIATRDVANAYALETLRDNVRSQARKLGITLPDSDPYGDTLGTYDSSIDGSSLRTLSANAQLDWEYNSGQYTALNEANTDGTWAIALGNAVQGVQGITSAAESGGASVVQAASGAQHASAGSVAGLTAGMSALSAGTTAVGMAVNLIAGGMQANVTLSKNEAIHNLSRTYQVGNGVANYFGGKTGVTYRNLLYQNQQERILSHNITTESTQKAKAIVDASLTSYQGVDIPNGGQTGTASLINSNNGNTSTSITANNKTTTDANATATQTVSKNNATRTQTTSKANAARTRSTSKANAARTQTTSKANNQRTYDNSIAAVEAGIKTDNIQAGVQITTASGIGWDTTPIGYQYNVTCPNSADALRIGERFNRYGYMCHRTIANPTLNVMPKWSYWKCSETTIIPNGKAPQQAVNYISNTLKNGITVWSNPNSIGDIVNE